MHSIQNLIQCHIKVCWFFWRYWYLIRCFGHSACCFYGLLLCTWDRRQSIVCVMQTVAVSFWFRHVIIKNRHITDFLFIVIASNGCTSEYFCRFACLVHMSKRFVEKFQRMSSISNAKGAENFYLERWAGGYCCLCGK